MIRRQRRHLHSSISTLTDLVIIMTNNQGYIAVFDSGVGGISVLKRLMKQMPNERYLYYGDSANAPYGDRSEEEILALTQAAVKHILTRPVKALVIACNTATAVAVEQLRQTYPTFPSSALSRLSSLPRKAIPPVSSACWAPLPPWEAAVSPEGASASQPWRRFCPA